MNTLTTIEQMIETINCLASIAEDALDLVEEYSGDESETAGAMDKTNNLHGWKMEILRHGKGGA